jgi:hypothetical protein
MVNRLEEDRFLAEFRLLEIGEALVRLNDSSKGANPIRFHATVSREVVLTPHSSESAQSLPTPTRGEQRKQASSLPSTGDSAWTIYAVLPSWAREAAKLASLTGNSISIAILESIVSRTQAKEMIHGPHRLFTVNGSVLKLTQLGGKVAAIQRSVSGQQVRGSEAH